MIYNKDFFAVYYMNEFFVFIFLSLVSLSLTLTQALFATLHHSYVLSNLDMAVSYDATRLSSLKHLCATTWKNSRLVVCVGVCGVIWGYIRPYISISYTVTIFSHL